IFIFLLYIFDLEHYVFGEVPSSGKRQAVDLDISKGFFTGKSVVSGADIESVIQETVQTVDTQLLVFTLHSFVGRFALRYFIVAENLETISLNKRIDHKGSHFIPEARVHPAGSKAVGHRSGCLDTAGEIILGFSYHVVV